jgi:hypothetical protein
VTISPSGIVPFVDVTVAVNVTGCPPDEGDPDVVSTVSEGKPPLLIRSINIADTLPILFISPE